MSVNFRGCLTATKNKNTNKIKIEILLDEKFQNYGIIIIARLIRCVFRVVVIRFPCVHM